VEGLSEGKEHRGSRGVGGGGGDLWPRVSQIRGSYLRLLLPLRGVQESRRWLFLGGGFFGIERVRGGGGGLLINCRVGTCRKSSKLKKNRKWHKGGEDLNLAFPLWEIGPEAFLCLPFLEPWGKPLGLGLTWGSLLSVGPARGGQIVRLKQVPGRKQEGTGMSGECQGRGSICAQLTSLKPSAGLQMAVLRVWGGQRMDSPWTV